MAYAPDETKTASVRLDGVLSEEERMLAFLAHELRAPLSGIGGLLGLLSEGALGKVTARQRDVLDLARRNIGHLECVVSEFLDFAALESGTLRLRPVPMDVQAVVQEVTRVLGQEADERGIRLVPRVRPPGVRVVLDPTRFREVVFNLVSNAIRHSPDAGRVDVVVTVDAGGLSLLVGDEGRGVSREEQEHMFEPFQSHDSFGIGLTLVQGIVQAQGGSVSVHEGSPGAVFQVRLPGTRVPGASAV